LLLYSEADRHFLARALCRRSHLHRAATTGAELPEYPGGHPARRKLPTWMRIHPGYGLLAENANFAEVCARPAGSSFIGPRPDVMRLMGEKEKARAAMKQAGVPILPGSDGIISSEGEACGSGRGRGGFFPVLVKGVGGRRRTRHAHRPQRKKNCQDYSRRRRLRRRARSAMATCTWRSCRASPAYRVSSAGRLNMATL